MKAKDLSRDANGRCANPYLRVFYFLQRLVYLYSRENPLKCIMFYIMGGANSVQTLRVQSHSPFLPPLSPFPFSPGRATPSSPRSPITRPRIKTRSKTPLFGLLTKEGAVLQSIITTLCYYKQIFSILL